MQKNYSIISSEFQGQTKTIIICANCGYKKQIRAVHVLKSKYSN